MLSNIKNNPNKIVCGLVAAVVLFGLFFMPLNVYANPWEIWGDDAAPPGNIYVHIPGQMPFPLPISLPEYLPLDYEPVDWPFNEPPYEPHNSPFLQQEIWQPNMLSGRELTRRQEGLDIRGLVPVIDESFAAAPFLNSYIDNDIVSSLVGEARRLRARSVFFRYDYFPSDNMVSVVIYADVLTTLPHTLVRSVNFCAFSGQLLSMNDAVGMEITPLAERVLAERVRQNPEHYYAALSAPIMDNAFYYAHGRLVILFDGFRLSTRVGDVQSIELFPANIRTVVLFPGEYRTDGPYGLKMIPLRTMLEGRFGFDVEWCEYEGRAIVRRNGMDLIELNINDNEYIVFGTQRRSLEVAPQMIDDRMYIPITFFDQILPLTTFTIEFDGRITFLSYLN